MADRLIVSGASGQFGRKAAALLINRVGERDEGYLLGIDECFRLAGLIRASWRGLSGGTEVWGEIGRFFAGLRQRAARGGGPAHA